MAHIITLPVFMLMTSLTQAQANTLPALPEPLADAAVLQTTVRGKTYILSAGGRSAAANNLTSAHRKSWLLAYGDSSWLPLPDIPSAQGATGRIAASAVTLDQQFFIFGGSGQGRNGQPVTLTDSYRLSPIGRMYQKLPDMPVAVYGSVALTYANRYVFLIGGNHQGNAVNLVQIFDNFTQKWSQATPYPMTAVSRHTAVLSNQQLLVCGGVRQQVNTDGSISPQEQIDCYLAQLNRQQPSQLQWRRLPDGPGALLDAAAINIGSSDKPQALFVGGHNSLTSQTINQTGWLFDFSKQSWQQTALPEARSGSRYLLSIGNEWYSLAGIDKSGALMADFSKQQFSLLPDGAP